MSIGQIQLGVKRSSGESLDRYSAQGFFYGGDVVASGKAVATLKLQAFTTIRNKSCIRSLDCPLVGSRVGNPARQHLIFYDNPSSKRVARCTNNPQTGALLTVKGVEQRLRKGFQEEQENGDTQSESSDTDAHGIQQANCRLSFGSLSSAAEIRH